MARLGLLRIAGGLLVLLMVAAAVIWLARIPIADEALRRALESRGVRAEYQVKSIGYRWERIEKLTIGDPAAPDLTAEWAEVRLSAGWSGMQATAIRAGGVRLRGRIVDGALTLGDVDKLLPKSNAKKPFALPNFDADLVDARVRVDSPWGIIAARIDGRGNLTSAFNAKIAAIAPSLMVDGCKGDRLTAYVDVAVQQGAPTIRGPVRANSAACRGAVVVKPEMFLNAAFGAGLDQWRGSADVKANGIKSGTTLLTGFGGKIDFDGSRKDTRGTFRLSGDQSRLGRHRLTNASLSGDFASAGVGSLNGKVQIDQFMLDQELLAKIESAAASSKGTPLGPLLAQLSQSLVASASVMRLDSDFLYTDGRWQLSRIAARGQNGAQLTASGGKGIEFGRDGLSADMLVSLMGGGLPTTRATVVRRADGMTVGVATIAPYATSGSQLILAPVKFAMNPAGAIRFETTALLDGPFNGGRVEGLRLPVNATVTGDGRAIINNGCTPVQFKQLILANFSLGPTATRLCPDGGKALFSGKGGVAVITSPHFSGRVGTTPLALTARRGRFDFGRSGFSVTGLVARLGSGNRISQLNVGSIDGQFAGGNLQGRISALGGKLANVPLLIDGGSGRWTYSRGRFGLNGNVRVFDEFVPARFNPLVSNDLRFDLADGRIGMTGTLRLPSAKPVVAKVQIADNLSAGTGTARFDVADLRFGTGFQPEQLTRLTVGVVANLAGSMSGVGNISWSPSGVISTGRFATDGMDLAAAFGPVTGLKGEIQFDDLLGLTTPAGQIVTIATINPGTLVTKGVVRYQLLPGRKIGIESGIWPFAGGDLLLDPTTLDMAEDSERRLTFRVVGLDAPKFVQQLEFENLSATGTFDGIIPMIFTKDGGKIEKGRLVARQGGGALSYVGDVSNVDTNMFANLAFDALKSIRYQRLTIDLNGPLDGEIVSEVYFNGINQSPLSPPKSFISRQLIGLPFVFNIKITAPFRLLLRSARDMQDPTLLIEREIFEKRRQAVQPPESERKP